MLRSTYSKIKNLCNAALVSRLLRPDQYSAACKFEKFPNGVQSVARKSTYTDDINDDGIKKKTDSIEYVYGKDIGAGTNPITPETQGSNSHVIQEMITENLTQMMTPADKNDRCKKLLAQAFGYGDADKNANQSTESKSLLNANTVHTKSENFGDSALEENNLQSVQGKENAGKHDIVIPELLKENINDGNLEDNIKVTISQKDTNISATVKEEVNKLAGKPNVVNAKHEKISKLAENNHKIKDPVLQAITTKGTKEELKQKFEHLEEPMIVTEKPGNVEGFNINPNILGGRDYNLEDGKDSEANVITTAEYDELAKQCLYAAEGNIDETLLKEMERLSLPVPPDTSKDLKVNHFDLMKTISYDPNQKYIHGKSKFKATLEAKKDEIEKLIPDKAVVIHEKCLIEDNGLYLKKTGFLKYERLNSIESIFQFSEKRSSVLIDDRITLATLPNLKEVDSHKGIIGITDTDKGNVRYDVDRLSDRFFSDKNIKRKSKTPNKQTSKTSADINQKPKSPLPLRPQQSKVNTETEDLLSKKDEKNRAFDHNPNLLLNNEVSKSIENEQLNATTLEKSEDSSGIISWKVNSEIDDYSTPWEQIDGAAGFCYLCENKEQEKTTNIEQERTSHTELERRIIANKRHISALSRGLGVGLIEKTITKSKNKAFLRRLQKRAILKPKREQSPILMDNRKFTEENSGEVITRSARAQPTDVLLDANIAKQMNEAGVSKKEFAYKLAEVLQPVSNVSEKTNLTELQERIRARNQLIQAKQTMDMIASQIADSKLPRPPKPPKDSPLSSGSPVELPGRHQPVCSKTKPDSAKFSIVNLALYRTILEAYENEDDLLKDLNSYSDKHKAILTQEIIEYLQNIGKQLQNKLFGKMNSLENIWRKKCEEVLLVKNYEPWTPIPSWPLEKNSKKKKSKTSKDCTKGSNERCTNSNPQFPSAGFPTKHYSALDDLPSSPKVAFDIGDF